MNTEQTSKNIFMYNYFVCFMNCEGSYLAKAFRHNLCPCFHNVFSQLGAITRTRNKSVEIVAALTRYLIINSGIKEKVASNAPSSKIS